MYRLLINFSLFFLSIIQIHASCSGIHAADDWDWLDAQSKKVVFTNYREMMDQYIQWRKHTVFGDPKAFGTMAAKARIILVDDDRVVQVIEANHGRRILHVDTRIISDSSPSALHESVFLPGEEEAYLEVLGEEKKILSSLSNMKSWNTRQHRTIEAIVEDTVKAQAMILKDQTYYDKAIKDRSKNVSTILGRHTDGPLQEGLFVPSEKTELYGYRDMHKYDAEAFIVDCLSQALRVYKSHLPKEYNPTNIKAFALFLTERDPCLSCLVTIKNVLRDMFFEEALGTQYIPIIVSLDNYMERKYNKDPTTIIIREKIKTMKAVSPAEVIHKEEKIEEAETLPPPTILHHYRDENLRGGPIERAETMYAFFNNQLWQAEYPRYITRVGAIGFIGIAVAWENRSYLNDVFSRLLLKSY